MDSTNPHFNRTTFSTSGNSNAGSADFDGGLIDMHGNYEVREQDRWLPLANGKHFEYYSEHLRIAYINLNSVSTIMKNALPPQAKLSKEAKMCTQECVSEFISFITSGAVDKSKFESRKTLSGEDILYALNTLGFENYGETLKIYLAKYREHEILDVEERRERDKRKRKLRKERKEKENMLQQHFKGATENDTTASASTYNDDLVWESLAEENENEISKEQEVFEDQDTRFTVLETDYPRDGFKETF